MSNISTSLGTIRRFFASRCSHTSMYAALRFSKIDELFLSLAKCYRAPFVLIFLLLLSSCSHVRRDGPPNFYVDETKIPNAVPKPEKLAKYGNMKQYYVFGKKYHVMKSSKNYSAVGTASWYGTMFHSRKTSSGGR